MCQPRSEEEEILVPADMAAVDGRATSPRLGGPPPGPASLPHADAGPSVGCLVWPSEGIEPEMECFQEPLVAQPPGGRRLFLLPSIHAYSQTSEATVADAAVGGASIAVGDVASCAAAAA
jgi:hypothetical protein